MTNLTANKPREFQGAGGPIVEFLMGANFRAFAGMALIEGADGTAAVAVDGGGGFLGFATEEVDNRTGSVLGGTAGSTTVAIQMSGLVWLTVASGTTFALTDVGLPVHASDTDTFTMTAGTSIPIGKVVHVPLAVAGAASGRILVYFEAAAIRSI